VSSANGISENSRRACTRVSTPEGRAADWGEDCRGRAGHRDRTAAGLAAARYVVILPSVTTCVERVASRGGHGFTSADATRGMHKDFADAELPARHLIADAGATPGDLAEIIHNGLNDGGFLWKVAY
jgi:hypothetical protein